MSALVLPRRPLLPPVVRRPAAWLVAACAVVVVLLGVRYHDDAVAGRLDAWVTGRIGTGPDSGALWTAATAVPVVATIAALVIGAIFALRRAWHDAVFSVAAPVVTIVVAEAAKHVVDRTIDGYLALPSGHTAGATSVLLVAAVVLLRRARAHVHAVAAALLLAVTAGAGAVGLIMVSVHAHYPTDTVAGYCTALVVTLGLALAIDGIAGRRAPAPPQASRTSPNAAGRGD